MLFLFFWPPVYNKCISPKKPSHRNSNSYSYFSVGRTDYRYSSCFSADREALALSALPPFTLPKLSVSELRCQTVPTFIRRLPAISKQSDIATRGALIGRQNIMAATHHMYNTALPDDVSPVKHVTGKSRQQFNLCFLYKVVHVYMSYHPHICKKKEYVIIFERAFASGN